MKIRNIAKLLIFSAVIAALFAVTCFMSSAANKKIVVTGGREYYSEEEYEWVTEKQDFTVEYGNSFEFTGSAIDPGIKVYKGTGSSKTLLTPNDDYYIYVNGYYYRSGDIMSPGEYYVEICSGDDYEYIFDCEFDVDVTFDSSKLKIGSISSKTYTGEVYKPTIKVYYGDTRLSSKFYDVDLEYGSNAGTYDVYVEMNGSFDYYEMSKTYKIKPVSVDNVVFGGISSKTYCGDEICPKPSVKFNDKKLKEYYDFNYSYSNNENVGTATVTINFKNNFTGSKKINFTIKKLSASKVTVNPIETQGYDGSKIEPYISAKVGYDYLYSGEDFTVKYSNNVKIGTAKAKLDFSKSKNITGTKTVEFQIGVDDVDIYNAGVTGNNVDLRFWSGGVYDDSAKIAVYKYNTSSKKYEYIGSTKTSSFADKNVKEFKTYKYRARAIVTQDGKTYYGKYSYKTVTTGLFPPAGVKLSVSKGKNTISWSKKSNADGYYVYRYDWEKDSQKKLATIKKNSTVKYVDESVTNYKEYEYWVVAYKEVDGKTMKSSQSEVFSTSDPKVISSSAKLTPKTSFKVMNVQGSKTKVAWTVNLSKNDIATLDKFAKDHFKKDWTAYQKVEYTLHWIHDKVKYARAGEDWNKISGKTYVDAIFNYKLGQCAQYNGALAAMMTHLGYDVELILGYRYYNSQHLWVECKINGLTYVMEAGNNKDGDWWYLFTPYRYAYGYTKNGKMMG